jgi:hypothetical protein
MSKSQTVLIINNSPEDVVRQNHICYFTRPGNQRYTLDLLEVLEIHYLHPETKQLTIPVITTRVVISNVLLGDSQTGAIELLDASERAVKLQCNFSNNAELKGN